MAIPNYWYCIKYQSVFVKKLSDESAKSEKNQAEYFS